MTLDRDAPARPRVLLDCDGVLADFVSAMLRVVFEVTGKTFEPEDVTEFNFARALGLSETDADNVNWIIGDRRKFCARLVAYPGAREGVRRLRVVADIHVVTSPWNGNETWTSEREWWLDHYFNIHHRDITHTSAKHLIVGDWLIDDKTETCRRWQESNPSGVAVQWITPHNRKDGWTGRATNSWDELCSWVAP